MEYEFEKTDVKTIENKKNEQEERLKSYLEKISKAVGKESDNE